MKIWIAEMDDRTCSECEAMHSMAITDLESWDDVVGCQPGEMHRGCRCFDWHEPGGQTSGALPREMPVPQGLESGAYKYILPVGALMYWWDDEELQYEEDDYESMLKWTEIW